MDQFLCFLIYIISAVSRLAKPAFRLGKPIKILLVGYNGAGNTGSDVRTAAIARQLKTLFGPDEIRITLTSR